jgi:hypothetical protein
MAKKKRTQRRKNIVHNGAYSCGEAIILRIPSNSRLVRRIKTKNKTDQITAFDEFERYVYPVTIEIVQTAKDVDE